MKKMENHRIHPELRAPLVPLQLSSLVDKLIMAITLLIAFLAIIRPERDILLVLPLGVSLVIALPESSFLDKALVVQEV
jgi:Na+-transporting methylmalonyl-CoA/oxaloacetate decarboxylase beta subunit